MLKKWIALVLSFILTLSVLPFTALADPETTEPATTPVTTEEMAEEDPVPPAEGEAEEEEDEPLKPKLEPLSSAQAAIPTNKLPTKAARIQRLRYLIQWDHQNALEKEERESLYGFCGLLTSYQLFYRGINTWRRSNDGKDYFDTYSVMGMTDGGYTIRSYNALKDPPKEEPAETPAIPEETVPEVTVPENPEIPEVTVPENPEVPETPVEPEKYTIADILNQVTNYGTREVYNLLVCFERTNTAAGTIYGHVVFIYGIIDGTVYFTEGGNMFGVEAGEPMECSISQFSASYATWAEFEGVIVFGNKDFMDNCTVYTSNQFVSCTEDVELLPLPDQVESTAVQRTAAKGERLQVIGLYHNRDGEYYYEILDDGSVCYGPVGSLKSILFLNEPFTLEDPALPQVLKPGKDMRLDGTIQTANYISRIRVSVLDASGAVVQEFTEEVNDSHYDLYDGDLNKTLDFGALPEGLYTLQVEAETYNWHVFRGNLAKRAYRETIARQAFAVGEDVEIPVTAEQPPDQTVKDGWVYENMTWYCYDQGAPVTGWKKADGIWYYLQEDGSVSTDWVLVDGELKLFTGTGAMRTGWVNTKMGRQYLLSDGSAVHGWLQIDGTYCYFNELGVLQEDHMRTTMNRMAQLDNTLYAVQPQEE